MTSWGSIQSLQSNLVLMKLLCKVRCDIDGNILYIRCSATTLLYNCFFTSEIYITMNIILLCILSSLCTTVIFVCLTQVLSMFMSVPSYFLVLSTNSSLYPESVGYFGPRKDKREIVDSSFNVGSSLELKIPSSSEIFWVDTSYKSQCGRAGQS